MYWQEEKKEELFQVPDDVVDVVFRIQCKAIPNDHAWELSQAVKSVLPWFGTEATHGLHLIHVAESGHGWERPQGQDAMLYPSRRTRLKLRLPKERVEAASALVGQTLTVAGNTLELGEFKTQLLAMTNTLYSRYVISPETEDDETFTARMVKELHALKLKFSKVISGKSHALATPNGPLSTNSLMVGGLSFPDAVELQIRGLGPERSLGCGLFIPYKSI
jgi:CRISPR-associated protein Cas6